MRFGARLRDKTIPSGITSDIGFLVLNAPVFSY